MSSQLLVPTPSGWPRIAGGGTDGVCTRSTGHVGARRRGCGRYRFVVERDEGAVSQIQVIAGTREQNGGAKFSETLEMVGGFVILKAVFMF